MNLHDLYLIIFAYFTEILGTLSGFGSSTFFVPIAVMFESFNFVLAMTAILHTFSNLSKIAIFHKKTLWKQLIHLALPSIALCGVGALLSNKLDPEFYKRLLGGALIIISLAMLIDKNKKISLPEKYAIPLSGISGFLTGLVGTGGALRGIMLSSLHLEKENFILLSAGIDLGGDLLRAVIYLYNGYMDWNQWFYIPLLAIAALLGAWTGKRVIKKLNQRQFEFIVAIFVLLSGITLVFP